MTPSAVPDSVGVSDSAYCCWLLLASVTRPNTRMNQRPAARVSAYVRPGVVSRCALEWLAVASSLALLAVTFLAYRAQSWAAGEAAEVEPRDPVLLGIMVVAILVVLFYAFLLF